MNMSEKPARAPILRFLTNTSIATTLIVMCIYYILVGFGLSTGRSVFVSAVAAAGMGVASGLTKLRERNPQRNW